MKENKLNIITELLVSELKPKRLILFGSRAKGTSLPNSDFDIAVEVKRIDFRRKRIIKEKTTTDPLFFICPIILGFYIIS